MKSVRRASLSNLPYTFYMTTKALLFSICILFLAACQPDLETIEVTARPTLTATVLAMDTATSVASPTPTATPTAVPPTPYPTATDTPTPTATPTAVLPSASVLFVRDDALQQWIPQTGEVKTLVENVTGDITYSADIAVFLRELTPEQDYALIVFHIPTQSEYELFRTSTTPLAGVGPFEPSTSISPNGRWLAYMSGDSRDSVTLTVHEIIVEDQQVTVSSPVLTVAPGNGWNWPYDQLTWPTENEISWSDRDGIWVADLSANPIEPFVAIAPSTNTFLFASPNPAYWDEEPDTVFTKFIPWEWSPDGHYLLAEEYFYEYGEFRVIERGTNHLIEIPDSGIGAVSDGAVWLDKTTLLHYRASGEARIWKINEGNDLTAFLQETIPAMEMGYVGGVWLFGDHLRVSDYASLFDLNLATGEFIELAQVAQETSWPPHWSPDGQHILWRDSGHVFLNNLNGDEPVEMEAVFGTDSCCWHWYEE
ncbi:MAG: hypothetical protein KF770_10190 [Anaerolineae bacterium]|nr:hypothetical protein [Anaerolineae bacterium]